MQSEIGEPEIRQKNNRGRRLGRRRRQTRREKIKKERTEERDKQICTEMVLTGMGVEKGI